MSEITTVKRMSYQEMVEEWGRERELLRMVQPYTARKSVQKALLFVPAFGNADVQDIQTADVMEALADLLQYGGCRRTGLSSTTLRAAHLAASQAFAWAIAKGIAESNPFVGGEAAS